MSRIKHAHDNAAKKSNVLDVWPPELQEYAGLKAEDIKNDWVRDKLQILEEANNGTKLLLPNQAHGMNLETLGFSFGDSVGNFYIKAELPKGWNIIEDEKTSRHYITDELNRKRLQIFQGENPGVAKFSRFSFYWTEQLNNDTPPYPTYRWPSSAKCELVFTDADNEVFRIGPISEEVDYIEPNHRPLKNIDFYAKRTTRDALQPLIEKVIKETYPDYTGRAGDGGRNACWDDYEDGKLLILERRLHGLIGTPPKQDIKPEPKI